MEILKEELQNSLWSKVGIAVTLSEIEEPLGVQLIASILSVYDESWKIEGMESLVGLSVSKSLSSPPKLNSDDVKNIKRWINMMGLGHLYPSGGIFTKNEKSFYYLLGSLLDKTEISLGTSKLQAKVRIAIMKKARKSSKCKKQEGKVDLDPRGTEESSNTIPLGSQIPRTPIPSPDKTPSKDSGLNETFIISSYHDNNDEDFSISEKDLEMTNKKNSEETSEREKLDLEEKKRDKNEEDEEIEKGNKRKGTSKDKYKIEKIVKRQKESFLNEKKEKTAEETKKKFIKKEDKEQGCKKSPSLEIRNSERKDEDVILDISKGNPSSSTTTTTTRISSSTGSDESIKHGEQEQKNTSSSSSKTIKTHVSRAQRVVVARVELGMESNQIVDQYLPTSKSKKSKKSKKEYSSSELKVEAIESSLRPLSKEGEPSASTSAPITAKQSKVSKVVSQDSKANENESQNVPNEKQQQTNNLKRARKTKVDIVLHSKEIVDTMHCDIKDSNESNSSVLESKERYTKKKKTRQGNHRIREEDKEKKDQSENKDEDSQNNKKVKRNTRRILKKKLTSFINEEEDGDDDVYQCETRESIDKRKRKEEKIKKSKDSLSDNKPLRPLKGKKAEAKNGKIIISESVPLRKSTRNKDI